MGKLDSIWKTVIEIPETLIEVIDYIKDIDWSDINSVKSALITGAYKLENIYGKANDAYTALSSGAYTLENIYIKANDAYTSLTSGAYKLQNIYDKASTALDALTTGAYKLENIYNKVSTVNWSDITTVKDNVEEVVDLFVNFDGTKLSNMFDKMFSRAKTTLLVNTNLHKLITGLVAIGNTFDIEDEEEDFV